MPYTHASSVTAKQISLAAADLSDVQSLQKLGNICIHSPSDPSGQLSKSLMQTASLVFGDIQPCAASIRHNDGVAVNNAGHSVLASLQRVLHTQLACCYASAVIMLSVIYI